MSKRKSVEPLYKLSDTVLCNFHGQLYDAIILETKPVDVLTKEKAVASESENSSDVPFSVRSMSSDAVGSDEFAYYLHYKNWNSGWDEWVRSDCLMSITEEARQEQQELKLAARREKIKRRSSSKKRKRRVVRKSDPSQNDNLDEGLSAEVGRANETLEAQDPMDDSVCLQSLSLLYCINCLCYCVASACLHACIFSIACTDFQCR